MPVPVEVPYPVPVPKPVEVPVYKQKIIEQPVYKEKIIEKPVYKEKVIYKEPLYAPPPPPEPAYRPPPPPAYHPPPPPPAVVLQHQHQPPAEEPRHLHPVTSVPAVPHHELPRHPPLPHHRDPHHPAIPHHDPHPLPTFTPPTHGPHLHHDLPAPELHLVTPLPNLDPLKASIVDKFNKQLLRTKRESKSDPAADPFPGPEAAAAAAAEAEPLAVAEPEAAAAAEAEAEAEAGAEAGAEAEAEGDPRHSIHDMSIEELQQLLHSINGKKLLSRPRPPAPSLGSHVLDLARLQGGAKLGGGSSLVTSVRQHAPPPPRPRHQALGGHEVVLGGDFLGEPAVRDKLSLGGGAGRRPLDALTLLGHKPATSVFSLQHQDNILGGQVSRQPDPGTQQQLLAPGTRTAAGLSLATLPSQQQQQDTELRAGKQTRFLSDDQIVEMLRQSPHQSIKLSSRFPGTEEDSSGLVTSSRIVPADPGLDAIFSDGLGSLASAQQVERQVAAPAQLGGALSASQLTEDIVAKVMEHLNNNKPQFEFPSSAPAPAPAPAPVLPPQLGGVVVSPERGTINDHFPLPHNPLPPHHEHRHTVVHDFPPHHGSHHQVIQEALLGHHQSHAPHLHHLHHSTEPLGYDPHVELLVKPSPTPAHPAAPAPPPQLQHPEPVITKTEIEAPPGCKAYSTRTCKKVPVVVPEKVPGDE